MKQLNLQEKINFLKTSLITVRNSFNNGSAEYPLEEVATLTGMSISSVRSLSIYEHKERFSRVFLRNRHNGLVPARYVYKYLLNKLRDYQYGLFCTYKTNVLRYGYLPRTFKEFNSGEFITSELLDIDKYCLDEEVMQILNISTASLRNYNERKLFRRDSFFPELYERVDVLRYKDKDLECNLTLCPECNKRLTYLSFTSDAIICNRCKASIRNITFVKKIVEEQKLALSAIVDLEQKTKEAKYFTEKFTQFYKKYHTGGGIRLDFEHTLWHVNSIQKSKFRTYYAAPDMIYSKDSNGVVDIHIISKSTGVMNHYLRMLEKFIKGLEDKYGTLERFYQANGFCEIIIMPDGTLFTHNHFGTVEKDIDVLSSCKFEPLVNHQVYYSQEEVVKLTGLCATTIYKYAGSHFLPRSDNGKFTKENVKRFIAINRETEYYSYTKDCIVRRVMPVSLLDYINGIEESNLPIDESYCSYHDAASILHVTKASIVRDVQLGYIQAHPEFTEHLIERKSLIAFQRKIKIKKIKSIFSKKKKVWTKKRLEAGYTLLEGYGTSTKEINLLRLRTDEQSTGKIIYTCQFILKHKKTKFVQLFLEKALLRMEVVEKMKNMDHEMSVTGYRFDF